MAPRLEEIHVTECTNCNSTKIKVDYEHAEIYCSKCGEVISEKLLDMDFRRSMADDIKYSPSSRKLFIRYKSMFETPEERALKPVHHELLKIDTLLDIPRYAKKQILQMYLELYRKRFTFGRSRTAVISALIYIISRKNDLCYYLDYIASATKTSRKQIRKFAGMICRELNIKLKPISPDNYLIKIGHELNLSQKTMTVAREVLEQAKGVLSGRSPITQVTLCLYVSSKLCSENCPLDLIRNAVGVYPDTIKQAQEVLESRIDVASLKEVAKWL